MRCVFFCVKSNTDEPGYNNIGLCDTSLIESGILCYKLIRQCANRNITLLGYNDTQYLVYFLTL
jgi:hypothetical protein